MKQNCIDIKLLVKKCENGWIVTDLMDGALHEQDKTYIAKDLDVAKKILRDIMDEGFSKVEPKERDVSAIQMGVD